MQVLTPCEEGRRLTSQDEPGRGQETPEEREPRPRNRSPYLCPLPLTPACRSVPPARGQIGGRRAGESQNCMPTLRKLAYSLSSEPNSCRAATSAPMEKRPWR